MKRTTPQQTNAASVGTQTLGLATIGNPQPPAWTPPPDQSLWPTPEFNQNQIADVEANSLQEAEAQATLKNNDLIRQYYSLMNSAYINDNAGRSFVLPLVPLGYGVTSTFDGTNSEWFEVAGMGLPVCNPLPAPPVYFKDQQAKYDSVPAGTIDIGVAMEPGSKSGFFHVGVNDRVANGQTVDGTSADGVAGSFHKIDSVIGAWYEKVG